MPKTVGVAFRPGGKVFQYDPEDLTLVIGDEVVVPAARGVEFGKVVSAVQEAAGEGGEPLKKVMRKATQRDRDRQSENAVRKEEAYRTCRKLIQKMGLPMKLVDVDYVFDGSSIVFYFTAEGRVDFRELVKELASTLKARIELRQVGVRDEAKIVGGLGPCGRDLCCCCFLSDFNPVSIKMAKEQDLPLNPSKISGICGRLMCCLKYEVDAYEQFNNEAPSLGTEVDLEEGAGRVVGYQVPKCRVVVELAESGRRVEVPLDDLEKRTDSRPRKGRKRRRPGDGGGGGQQQGDQRGAQGEQRGGKAEEKGEGSKEGQGGQERRQGGGRQEVRQGGQRDRKQDNRQDNRRQNRGNDRPGGDRRHPDDAARQPDDTQPDPPGGSGESAPQ